MISLAGNLAIKIISGRNGNFRVGVLQTDIGNFSVKDKMLDQYEEGSYQGLFTISKICIPVPYTTGSRLVVEMRATLDNIALEGVGVIEPEQYQSLEQDPLDEEKAKGDTPVKTDQGAQGSNSHEALSNQEEEQEDQSETEKSDDEILFGLLWPLQDSFKIDPTVDRELFRQQRERLKKLGYTFKPIGQYWVKP